MNRLVMLIVLNLIYIIPASIIFLQRGNMEFIAYLGIVLLLGLLVVNFVKKGYLTMLESYLLSIWGFLHIMGGLLIFSNGKVLYQQILIDILDKGGGFVLLKMDQFIHFYGFGLIAYIMYRVLKEKTKKDTSKLFLMIFSVIIAIGFGAMNEVIEFAVVLSTEFNGVGDLYNMGFDLIFNLAGAVTGAFISYWKNK